MADAPQRPRTLRRCRLPRRPRAARRPAARPADPGQLPHRHADRVHDGPDALRAAPGGLPARAGRRRVPPRGCGRRGRCARPRPRASASATRAARTASCCSTPCAPRRSTWSSSTPAPTSAPVPAARPRCRWASCSTRSTATAGRGRGRRACVVRHPLQPFDARNFTAGALGVPGPFSFDRVELDGCRAAAGGQAPPPPFLPGPLPASPGHDDRTRRPRDLRRAPREAVPAPARGAPDQRGGRRPADALPVALDALQRWAVGDRLLRDRLAGLDLARCRAAEWRRGELPPGELGNSLLAEVLDDVEELVAASARFVAGVPTSQEVDVSVGRPDLPDGARVVGTVSGVHGDTAVRVEFSKLAAKQRVRAWVRLVALTAALPDRRWRVVTVGRGARGGVAVADRRARGRRPRPRRARRPGRPAPRRAARATATADDRRAGLCPHRARGGGTADDALAEALRGWCEGRFPERDDAVYTPRVRPRRRGARC